MIIAGLLLGSCVREIIPIKITREPTTSANIALFDSLVRVHINDSERIKRKYSKKVQDLEHKNKIERINERLNK